MKKRPYLVALVGGSGSGKSWLAGQLLELLGRVATRVSLDDFYRDRSGLSPAQRARINYDHPRAIDWERVQQFLEDCRRGGAARMPRYDFRTHTRQGEQRAPLTQLVFFEGLWLLVKPGIRRCFDFSVYLQCPAEVRLERRLARDLIERGRTADSVRQQFKLCVGPMHRRFVAPQRGLANLVLRHPLGKRDVTRLAGRLRSIMTPKEERTYE